MKIVKLSVTEWKSHLVTDTEILATLPFSIDFSESKLGFSLDKYWEDGLGEFKGSGLSMDEWIFYLSGPVNSSMEASIAVRGNESRPLELLQNICACFEIKFEELAWVAEIVSGPKYIVVRLDDNNNEVEMDRFLNRRVATCFAQEFESRGHKQTYSVRKIK